MIYIGKAVPGIMTELDSSFMNFIGSYKPQLFDVPSEKEAQTKIKKFEMNGFISGAMRELNRNDENLISRDCLVIDLDDVLVSENELKKRMETIFKEDGVSYALYPSLRNGIAGVRYRLCVPLDREVNKEENSLLVKLMSERILKGIIGIPDASNATWSQLMLLPVITQHNKVEDVITFNGTQLMPAQEFIERARDWQNSKNNNKSQRYIANQYKTVGKTFLGGFLDELVDGVAEGDRDRWLTSKVGTFLKQGMDVENAYSLAVVVNDNFINPPLSASDVIRIVLSISKKELKRRGV